MVAVKTPRMVKHRNEEPGEMSQVSAQKQALRDDRAGPLQGGHKALTPAKGSRGEKPSETAISGLVDRP